MPENDLIRRSLDLGMAVTQLTRQRAEQLVRDLVRAGEVSREQATSRVEELLERSRQNSEALIAIVRGEIDSRVAQLNLVSR
ncbi:MAG: phasin family protein, partial [Acidimicrobiales bacterium]